MKKMLIVSNNMKIGGIQRSLVNFLIKVGDKYEVDLLLFDPTGSYYDEIPKNINLLPNNKKLSLLAKSRQESKALGIGYHMIKLLFSSWSYLFSNHIPFKILMKDYKINKKYDIAISFVQANSEKKMYYGCNEFVINKVSAEIKAAFIHCDLRVHDGNTEHNKKYYRKFDKVIGVSESVKIVYDNLIRTSNQKTYKLYNFQNYRDIINKSEAYEVMYDDERVNLIYVGRISDEKGVDRLVYAADILREQDNFTISILGDGPELKKLEELILNLKVSHIVQLIASKSNPYPYIKSADALILPSHQEAAPMVYGEAAILGTPILTTKTLSAIEMVENNSLGLVCENSLNGIVNMIKEVINEPAILHDFSKKNESDSEIIIGASDEKLMEILNE